MNFAVYTMLPRMWTHRTASLKKKTPIFLFSLGIFGQNIQDIQLYGLNCYSFADIVLQLCVLLKTWRHPWAIILGLRDTLLSSCNVIEFLVSVTSLHSIMHEKLVVLKQNVLDLLSAQWRGLQMIVMCLLIEGVPHCLLVIVTGVKSFFSNLCSAVTLLFTVSSIHFTNLTIVLQIIERGTKIVIRCVWAAVGVIVNQFFTALLRECEIRWLGCNFHIHQEEDQNRGQAVIVFVPYTCGIEHIPRVHNRLANRVLNIRRHSLSLTCGSHHEPDSGLQDADGANRNNLLSHQTDEPVEDLVGASSLCRLEIVPCEAAN